MNNEAQSLMHVTASPELRQVLLQITERMSEFMDVERSSVFCYDPEKEELWTPAAQGMEGSDEIRVKLGQGIAGTVMESGEALRIDDPYNDPRFFSDVDRRSGFRTHNLFCRPISAPNGRRIGVIQLLNKHGGPLTVEDEKLLDVLCSQAAIAIENAQLYNQLKKVHVSEQALHEKLQQKHGELQKAFVEIEHAKVQQDILERRMRKIRYGAAVGIVVLFAAIGLYAWRIGSNSSAMVSQRAEAQPTGPVEWWRIEAEPISKTISLLGNIEPLEIIHLTSPFKGRVAEMNFRYGELVEKGQLLARIDTTDLEIELRNARIATIKAQNELKRLQEWKSSPEVARAERSLSKAKLSYEASRRNHEELEELARLGIIAASSLQSAEQQLANQETDYRAAQADLENIIAKVGDERVTIARYELENTLLRVGELEKKISRAEIHAPFSGIVILPNSRPIPNRNKENGGFFEVGTTITQGEVLVSLGNLEGIAVRTRADEVDVARLRHGQRVRITGEAFSQIELEGEVFYLSSQAILTSGWPYFEVGVRSDSLSDEERAAIRLGMTAMLDIFVYDVPEAVVVPVNSVFTEAGTHWVWCDQGGGLPTKVSVRCGQTTPTGVEILEGLAPGDVIAVNAGSVSG